MDRFDRESRLRASLRRIGRALGNRREIIVRSGGRIRHFALPRGFSALALVLGASIAGWTVYSTIALMSYDHVLAHKERQIADSQHSYRELVEGINTSRDKFVSVARLLEQNHYDLVQVIDHNDVLKSSLVETEQRLYVTEHDARLTNWRSVALAEQLHSLEGQVATVEQSNKALSNNLQSAQKHLSNVMAERRKFEVEREVLRVRVTDLELRLTDAQRSQNVAVNRMVDATLKDIDAFERVIARLGLSLPPAPKKQAARRPGVGGPFIPVAGERDGDSFGAALVSLVGHMDRREELRNLLKSLPLAAPLDQFRIGSGYGRRNDPFNGRAGVHQGVDLTADTHTPILAPAPGRVLAIAHDDKFGRVVEIDHGYGVVTRYAHLSRVLVKKGQRVSERDQIGLVGSSGRSTGPHLHYEILVNGKPVDPVKFMGAGADVLKG